MNKNRLVVLGKVAFGTRLAQTGESASDSWLRSRSMMHTCNRSKGVPVRLVVFCAEKVDDYWEPAKKHLLADAKGFMDNLVNFDKDNIPDRIIQKARPRGGLDCCTSRCSKTVSRNANVHTQLVEDLRSDVWGVAFHVFC